MLHVAVPRCHACTRTPCVSSCRLTCYHHKAASARSRTGHSFLVRVVEVVEVAIIRIQKGAPCVRDVAGEDVRVGVHGRRPAQARGVGIGASVEPSTALQPNDAGGRRPHRRWRPQLRHVREQEERARPAGQPSLEKARGDRRLASLPRCSENKLGLGSLAGVVYVFHMCKNLECYYLVIHVCITCRFSY